MSTCLHHERSMFGFEEFEAILKSHHPFVGEIEGAELTAMRGRLRDMRDRERTLAHDKRREARGKGPARGAGHPGTADQPKRRKQVVASALRRVNAELARRRRIEARARTVEAAQRALAMRRAAAFRAHPDAETFCKADRMRSLPGRKRRVIVHGARIGSVSQANKRAQKRRDSRA
jgi:hypothetical protein